MEISSHDFYLEILKLLEKLNIANDGLVDREQERRSGSLAHRFPAYHTPMAGDVRQNCRESITHLQKENSGS